MRRLPFEYSVRNLGRSPSRLVLAVGGSALVVLLLLVAGGFVEGMRRSLGSTGGQHNVILLGAGSEESVERSEVDMATPGLLAASVPGIRERGGVVYVSPEVHVMLPVAVPGGAGSASIRRLASLRGVTPAAALVHEPVALIEGRWPRAGQDELMVGRMAQAALGVGDGALEIGRTVQIEDRPWTVVGRYAAPGTVLDAELWLPLVDLQMLSRRNTLSCVVVTLDPYDEASGEGAEFDDIAVFTKTRPDLELVAIPEREYYAKLAAFLGPIQVLVWLTAGLIACGAVLGSLNSTFAAFASRGRELGMLQALGYRRPAILWSMVEESSLATAAGGVLACAIGALVLDGLAVRFSMGAFGLAIDPPVLGLGLLVGLLLGVVGALLPGIQALRPPIPEALKSI